MEYMLLITVDESAMPPVAEGGPSEAFLAYNQRLIDGGHWISGASLQPSSATTVVHKAAGSVTATTDGPFTESKEQVAGYYLVRADDLDQALELAGAIPIPFAAVEVRPLGFRADA